MENKSEFLKVAIKAALEAGKILEKYFETEILKEFKEDTSIVTLADRESEEVIKKIILNAFPTHSILGEEMGMAGQEKDHVLHVCSVGGPRKFFYGISLFYASKGKGAYLNNKRIFVSKDDKDRAIITVSPGKLDVEKKLFLELFHDLPNIIRSTRNLGCTALELSYIARSGIEANIQLGWSYTYDFAAGTLLVQEAGGTITMLDGSPWKFPEHHFISSNGVFHNLLVEEVKKQKAKLNIKQSYE